MRNSVKYIILQNSARNADVRPRLFKERIKCIYRYPADKMYSKQYILSAEYRLTRCIKLSALVLNNWGQVLKLVDYDDLV